MNEVKIFLETGYLLDSSFERVLQNQKAIAQLLPTYQTAWERFGTQFVRATLDLTGQSFHRAT